MQWSLCRNIQRHSYRARGSSVPAYRDRNRRPSVQEPAHDVVIETSKERPPCSAILSIQSKATSQLRQPHRSCEPCALRLIVPGSPPIRFQLGSWMHQKRILSNIAQYGEKALPYLRPKRHPQPTPRSNQFSAPFQNPCATLHTPSLLPFQNASGAGSPEGGPISRFGLLRRLVVAVPWPLGTCPLRI